MMSRDEVVRRVYLHNHQIAGQRLPTQDRGQLEEIADDVLTGLLDCERTPDLEDKTLIIAFAYNKANAILAERVRANDLKMPLPYDGVDAVFREAAKYLSPGDEDPC